MRVRVRARVRVGARVRVRVEASAARLVRGKEEERALPRRRTRAGECAHLRGEERDVGIVVRGGLVVEEAVLQVERVALPHVHPHEEERLGLGLGLGLGVGLGLALTLTATLPSPMPAKLCSVTPPMWHAAMPG